MATEELVASFVSDRCDTGPGLRVAIGDLHDAYLEWMKDEERVEWPLPSNVFSRYLRQAVPIATVRVNMDRDAERVQVLHYSGIALREDEW